ncbi:MAG: glycosyl hydrolase [Bacteroidetes bacterium]|nr:glycosyl hydrolase [Bacteroidota bacterium]
MRRLTILLFLVIAVQAMAQVKPTPASDRLQKTEQRKALLQRSLLNGTSFRNIGPSVMSGRVVDLEVNPNDPTEFYVAYASGGLWHTTNNGQSFVSIFDSEDILTLGDIAVNWKTRTIWVGTGEVNSSRSSYAGIGVYKSGNNGKSWEYLGLPESHHIGKILLHPADDNTAWVAVLGHLYSPNKERGVYKTTDGGKSWKQSLAIDDNTGAIDIDLNPQNANELYAAMWYKTRSASNFEEGGKTSGIYKSVNGGDSWELVSKEGSGFPSGDGVGRIGLAVSQQNPNVVYAVVDNNFHQPDTALSKTDTTRYVLRDFKELNKEQFQALDDKKFNAFISNRRNGIPQKYTAASIKESVANGRFSPSVIWDYLFDANTALFETPIIGCELYRSDDAGKTWKKTNTKPLTMYSTYGYYFGKVFVSPANDNKVVLTGFDVQMSIDGGKTFKFIGGDNVHADHHVAWMNPKRDSHMLIGNDGGCNITYDNGEHWFKANTPPVGQFYNVAVDMAKPYNVYGGLQDNGTWYGKSTTRENFDWFDSGHNPYTGIGGGDGMQVQVDWRDNKTVYSGSQFGAYARQNLATGEYKSVRPSRDLGEASLRYNWQTPILLSRHNQDVFYYGSNKFHRSFNRGDSSVVMSADLTTNPKQGDVPFGTATTMSESPLRFGLVYVGTDDGNIQVTKDGGYSWELVNRKLPKGLYVSRVFASAFKEGRVYASLNGYRNDHFLPYLYVSEDYGATWKVIGKNLPNEPINVVKEDLTNENILYVGTDGGLYVSIDGGASWMMWNKGLPYSVPVHDLVQHPRENELVLGTHGRSLYIARLDEIQKLAKDADYRAKKEAELNKAR